MPGLFLPRSRPWLLSTAAERRFEVRSCKPTSRGRPSSVKQLRTIRSRELLVLMAHDCRLSGSRQSGNYQLINIKMPADRFVPRLVMKNAHCDANVRTRPVIRSRYTSRLPGVIVERTCNQLNRNHFAFPSRQLPPTGRISCLRRIKVPTLP